MSATFFRSRPMPGGNFARRCRSRPNGPISTTPPWLRCRPRPSNRSSPGPARPPVEGDTCWPAWNQRVERRSHTGGAIAGRRRGRSGAGAQHDRGHRPGGRRFSLARGRQRRHARQRVSLEPVSLDEPGQRAASRRAAWRREQGRVDLDRLEAACDARTRIISVSWVGYVSGWRVDLNALVELAKRQGALLFVDAIQGLGVFPLDVKATPIDFLAADGHKWLLGPEGRGAVLSAARAPGPAAPDRRRLAQRRSTPPTTAASSWRSSPRPRATKGARKTWSASWAWPTAWNCCWGTAQQAIARRMLDITDLACERLRQAGAVDRQPPRGRSPLGHRVVRAARPATRWPSSTAAWRPAWS